MVCCHRIARQAGRSRISKSISPPSDPRGITPFPLKIAAWRAPEHRTHSPSLLCLQCCVVPLPFESVYTAELTTLCGVVPSLARGNSAEPDFVKWHNPIQTGDQGFTSTLSHGRRTSLWLLSRRLTHLRRSFDDAHSEWGPNTQSFCYALLHGGSLHEPANAYSDYLTYINTKLGAPATQRFEYMLAKGTPPAILMGFYTNSTLGEQTSSPSLSSRAN